MYCARNIAVGLADHLAFQHTLTDTHEGFGLVADVLMHGHDQPGGQGCCGNR